jgi:hypothetical protein
MNFNAQATKLLKKYVLNQIFEAWNVHARRVDLFRDKYEKKQKREVFNAMSKILRKQANIRYRL